MYFRCYSNKNNTLFHYVKQVTTSTGFNTITASDNINCGANSIMELGDGHMESRLIWAFILPDWLKTKLSSYSYQVNLQLFDAGTLFLPAINLKQVDLESFNEDFSEGDGYSFLPPENKIGVSNWIQRDSQNLWEDVIFTPVISYVMNSINEDYNFNVTSSIATFLTGNIDPKFSLKIHDRTDDPVNVFTKYIHSNYTKTVFKPYLEFFIEDTVVDETFNCIAGQPNNIYLLNQAGSNFSLAPTCSVTYDNNTTITPTVNNFGAGQYYITITPPMPITIKTTYATILWTIGELNVQRQIVQVCTPDKLFEDVNYENLYFYPATSYSHNIVRQGDIMPFTIVSQIRGKGDVVTDTYEYKITSADGFEMVPWTKTCLYRKKIYFFVNTDYFFPENQYEVWIRNNTKQFTITSNLTHKFKLAANDKSHLRQLSTSPYYSRDQFLSK